MKKCAFAAFILLVCLLVQAQTIFAQSAAELVARAKTDIDNKDYAAALSDSSVAIKLDANNAEAFATRAHAYIQLGKYETSLTDSSRATAISPNFGWAYYLHGIASLWQTKKDFAGALADFTKVIALEPTLAADGYRFRAGIHNEYDKDYWAAIADANEAIKLNPADGNAYAQRGWANTQLNNYEKARDDYRQSIKFNFATSGVYETLGYNEFKLNDYEQAAVDTRKAIELDPNNQDAKNNLAGILAQQQQNKSAAANNSSKTIDDAATDFLKEQLDVFGLKNKYPDAADLLKSDAQKKYEKGDYAGAVASVTEEINKNPTADKYELRARAYFQLKDYDRAVRDVNLAMRNSESKYWTSKYELLGDIYTVKQDNLSARVNYIKALAISPNNESIKQKLNALYQTKLSANGTPDLNAKFVNLKDKFNALSPKYTEKVNAMLKAQENRANDRKTFCAALIELDGITPEFEKVIDEIAQMYNSGEAAKVVSGADLETIRQVAEVLKAQVSKRKQDVSSGINLRGCRDKESSLDEFMDASKKETRARIIQILQSLGNLSDYLMAGKKFKSLTGASTKAEICQTTSNLKKESDRIEPLLEEFAKIYVLEVDPAYADSNKPARTVEFDDPEITKRAEKTLELRTKLFLPTKEQIKNISSKYGCQ